MSNIVVSEKIKEYRKVNNVSQNSLGELLGVSPQAVSKWERGLCYPDISVLPLLAELLQCSVNDFFENKNQNPN